MQIAICGIRGIPACYGGFETFAEELSVRLISRGHEVVVYGRKHVIDYEKAFYRGIKIKKIYAPKHKYFETPLHTLFCFLDLVFHPVDVVLVCNAANSPLLWILRLRQLPVVVNVDGIERLRAKWNVLGRIWYRLGEWCSVHFASTIIADAEVIRRYYLQEYHRESVVIGYGYTAGYEDEKVLLKLNGSPLNFHLEFQQQLFEELGVQPEHYILYVSRLEPENNAHVVIEAYNQLPVSLKSMPLLIVGDAPYASYYIASLRELAGQGVIFAGYRFGESYKVLQLGAYVYIQATEVGGTHPALVEAMGFGNCVIANETPENIEVVADAGLFYKRNDPAHLSAQLRRVLQAPDVVTRYRKLAFQRIIQQYDWEKVTTAYENIFRRHSKNVLIKFTKQ